MSRATDAILPYCLVASDIVTSDVSNKTVQKDAAELLVALRAAAEVMPTKTGLETDRKNYAQNLLKSVKVRALNKALKRVLVEERLTEELVSADLTLKLQAICQTPADRAIIALHGFKEVVDANRLDGGDIHGDMMEVLSAAKTPSIRPLNGLLPPVAESCLNALKKDRVLLLTGDPRVGKTFLAHLTAAEFETQGYTIVTCSSLDVAERQVGSRLVGGTLIVLEDPLKRAQNSLDYVAIYARIEQLISSLPPNDLLIVTEATPDLLEGQKLKSLERIKTRGHQWTCVENDDSDFKEKVWTQALSTGGVPTELDTLILEYLRDSGEIELGALTYLAANADQLLESYDLADALRLARQDAAGIAATISNATQKHIMFTLALGTVAGESMSLGNLVRNVSTPHFANEEPLIAYWDRSEGLYAELNLSIDPLATGDTDFQAALNRLEQRTLIDISSQNEVRFNHPIYRNVGESLFSPDSFEGRSFLNTILRRTIFGPVSDISQASALNLSWMYDQYRNVGADSSLLRDLAIKGMNSAFPATRDLCFEFLMRYARLDGEEINLTEFAHELTNTDINSLEWIGETAVIKAFRTISSDDWADELFRTTDPELTVKLKADFTSNETLNIPPKHAVDLLDALRGEPEELTAAMMRKLLLFNEAVIRAEAARAWVSTERDSDEAILNILAGDRSPIVAREILSGSISGWATLSPERKKTIIDLNKVIGTEPGSALLLLNRWLTFNRYDNDETVAELWRFFAGAFPTTFEKVRALQYVDSARLHEILRQAPRFLSEEELKPLYKVQVSNIQKIIESGRIPGDYYFGIIDLIFNHIVEDREYRGEALQRLFDLEATSIRMRVAAELTNNYSVLSDGERRLFEEWVSQESSDRDWLHAAVITRNDPPEEFFSNCLDVNVPVGANHSQILEAMPLEILQKADRIHLGQCNDFYDLSSSAIDVFADRIQNIAKDINHPLFFATWNDLRAKGHRGSGLADIIQEMPVECDEVIFQTLLIIFRKDNGWLLQAAWAVLFERCESAERRADWISAIVEAIPDQVVNVRELANEFPEDIAYSIAGERLSEIQIIVDLNRRIKAIKDDALPTLVFDKDSLDAFFREYYALEPIFLEGYDLIMTLLRSFDTEEATKLLEEHKPYRDDFLAARHNKTHVVPVFPEPRLDEGWIPMTEPIV